MRPSLEIVLLAFGTLLALLSAAYNLFLFVKRDQAWVQILLESRRSNLLVFPKDPLVAAIASAFMAAVFLSLLVSLAR